VPDGRLVGTRAESDAADVVAPIGTRSVGDDAVVVCGVEALGLPDVRFGAGGLEFADGRRGQLRAQLGDVAFGSIVERCELRGLPASSTA
jgi:hypothetical protein